MNRIKCLVIDDEPIALKKMETYFMKSTRLELVALCESPVEALPYLHTGQIDAMFLDINMPDINGIDFLSSLPHPPLVVFTTAYSEYAVESYRWEAVDYLLKPFDLAAFQRAALRLIQRFETKHLNESPTVETGSIYVKVDYRYVNIRVDDILFIKGMNEYVQIVSRGRRPLMSHVSMRQILERLPGQFLQVHRSYIVNMTMTREIDRMSIIIDDDGNNRIPVGDNYRKDLQEYLQRHSLIRK